MTAKEYSNLLLQFDPKSEEHRKAFEKITYRYPYFQSAYAHYLKTLKAQEQYNFNLILRKTAVLSPSRTVLNQWLEDINLSAESKEVIETPAPQIEKSETKEEVKPLKVEVTPTTTEEKQEPKAPAKKKAKAKAKPKKKAKPLNMTYADWVIYSAKGKIEKRTAAIGLEDKNALIDKFLENQPKIPPVQQDQPKVDLSANNAFNKDELMTETLAKVYLQQKKYKKARYAYEILSLKYPEKNSFFADQIKKIKQLQQNS